MLHLVRFVRLLSSRQLRFLAVTVVAVVVCDAAAAYQVGVRARRPPSFRRGGRFLEAAGAQPEVAVAPADSTTTMSAPATSSDPTAPPGRTATTRARIADVAATAPGAPAPASGGTPGAGGPASGTYTWNVSG